MTKISVRHGIARAYGFLFGRLFQILGLSWLPAVFYAVAATFLIQRMSGAMQSAVPADAGLLGEYAFFYLLALITVTAFLGAVIAVPLAREALGLREESVAVHFVVGAREARMFFALLRFYAVVGIVMVAVAFAAGIGVTAAAHYAAAQNLHLDWAGVPLQAWLNLGAAVIAACVFLIVAARLGFLLAPLAAVEKHAGLGRAGHLSRGNFWQIAFTYVVVGLPATLLLVTCETTFGGLEMGKTLPSGMQAFYTVQHDHIAIFAAVLAAGLVVLQALFAGASASAYEELADAAAYEAAPTAAPAFHEPAMAFADAGPRGFADARPTDHRTLELREDMASRAAAEAAMPVMEETVVQPAEQPLPAETPDVQEQLPLHDNPNPEAAAHQAAALPLEEHAPEPAAIVEHVEPVPEHAAPMPVESVTADEPGEAVGHEPVVHTETEAAHDDQSPIIIEHSATQAPPLDPVGAMAAAAPHEEHAPPA